jgi:hypothetical protein
MERPVAGGREVVGELLDPWLVRHGWMRVRRAGRGLCRILSPCTMHVVVLLCERVVGLELVVGDRPGRRDAVVVLQLAEVLLAQAVQRRAVQLRGTADVVVNSRLKGLAAGVVPRVRRDVAVVHEHVLVRPVRELARKPVTALEEQDALPGRREMAGKCSAARAGPDDDHVVGVHYEISSSRSARMIRAAASINARCENACGKLPR